MTYLRCIYCHAEAVWSRLFDQYWCEECRLFEVEEIEDDRL